MKSGIYEIKNRVNGKRYIGSSNNITRRWRQHRHCLRNNRHRNDYLQKAYNKYGEENFTFSVVVETPVDGMLQAEADQIALYEWNMLYNLEREPSRPNQGYKLSDEQIEEIVRLYTEEKLSASAIAKRYDVGGWEYICRHLHRLGVKLRSDGEARKLANTQRTFTLERELQIANEYRGGATIVFLAKKHYGVEDAPSENQKRMIRRICKRNGAPLRKRTNIA